MNYSTTSNTEVLTVAKKEDLTEEQRNLSKFTNQLEQVKYLKEND